MTNHKIQFVGAPCGQHGNYTFYKAFKYSLHGKQKILALGEFFFIKIWEEEDIISIAETQLLWEDKTSGQILVSLRIYFLPENTPEGRGEEHGEHEVVSLSEKVVLRADDVINIMRAASGVKWDAGLYGIYGPEAAEMADTPLYRSPLSESLDVTEVLREKNLIGDVIESNTLHVIVLSYDSYCRMRALLKRLEGVEEDTMKTKIVKALGGFLVPSKRTRLLFCRDVFEYPELETHDLLCNHLDCLPRLVCTLKRRNRLDIAPKLQGRPRKKRPPIPDSESESSETSEDQKPRIKPSKPTIMTKSNQLIRGLATKNLHTPKINPSHSISSQMKSEFSTPALDRLIEVDFMSKLYKFMKDRNTAITRLPYIGFKQLNVFELFTRVQQYGGYEVVGQKKLWKHLYEDIAGKQGSQPNAASQNLHAGVNGLKRHYERLLLPYENYLLQEQRKILGIDGRKSSHRPQKLLHKHHKYHHHHHNTTPITQPHHQSQNSNAIKHSSHSSHHSQQNAHHQQHNENQQLQHQQQHQQQQQQPQQQQQHLPQQHQQQQQQQPQLQHAHQSQQSQQHQSHIKNDPGEPSVSILQPVSPQDPIGASFQVADGGSTTITLVPVGETDQLVGGSSGSGTGSDRSSPPPVLNHQPFANVQLRSDTPPPLHYHSSTELTVPKVSVKKENQIPADLAKRPEITITPIPRAISSLGPGSLTPLQLADLMTLNVNLNSTLGVSALQDLAKIAERYDRATSEPSPKKHKSDDMRVNGANQRHINSSIMDSMRSQSPLFPDTHLSKNPLSVPDLVSADFFRQMNALDSNSKLLLPAHQSTKTINALAALLPQTSIFPAPAPAAHQQHNRSLNKPQVDSTKPEPVFQSLSVYSQSKNIYGRPIADVTKENSKDSKKRNSPDIEILDLRIPNDNKNSRISKNERLEMELLDLSTRRDITVSAVPKPGTSKNCSSGRIPPPHVSIKSTDNGKSVYSSGGSSGHPIGGSANKSNSLSSAQNHAAAAAALASAFAAQGIPPALASLGLGSPSLLHYLMSSGMKSASPAHGSMPLFPYLDAAALASYYSLLPHGLLSSGQTGSNSSAAAVAVHQAAAAAQLAQLNSLGLAGLSNISPEAMASLGIYKNYLPQGNLPPPHFLSGLMSPGGPNPPTSK